LVFLGALVESYRKKPPFVKGKVVKAELTVEERGQEGRSEVKKNPQGSPRARSEGGGRWWLEGVKTR